MKARLVEGTKDSTKLENLLTPLPLGQREPAPHQHAVLDG
jgi:hypothetical protein